MTESTVKIVKKTLQFEESGETFSIEICLKNLSPSTKRDTIIPFLDTLFERTKSDI